MNDRIYTNLFIMLQVAINACDSYVFVAEYFNPPNHFLPYFAVMQ